MISVLGPDHPQARAYLALDDAYTVMCVRPTYCRCATYLRTLEMATRWADCRTSYSMPHSLLPQVAMLYSECADRIKTCTSAEECASDMLHAMVFGAFGSHPDYFRIFQHGVALINSTVPEPERTSIHTVVTGILLLNVNGTLYTLYCERNWFDSGNDQLGMHHPVVFYSMIMLWRECLLYPDISAATRSVRVSQLRAVLSRAKASPETAPFWDLVRLRVCHGMQRDPPIMPDLSMRVNKALRRFLERPTKPESPWWLVGYSACPTCSVCEMYSAGCRTCSGCGVHRYCSTACQKTHWVSVHHHDCDN